jgi:2',3'-cyclic-nucleotide 2'-phosphodiesterase (5'-nucleotidase family)
MQKGSSLFKKCIVVGCLILFTAVSAIPQTAGGERPAPATFDERLGADDGAALAILFGANMRGNLDLCDCNQPRGGLARRVGYLEGFRKKFKETPVVHVEAGQFWYNSETDTPLISAQNDFVARAYSRWQMDVINLSRYDLLYANRVLSKAGLPERLAAMPMLKNLISANGRFASESEAAQPFLIREVRGPRIKGLKKSIKIGFLGLAEPLHSNSGMMDITVKNMFETARQFIPRLRKQCDVLVILAHAEFAGALRLAKENPEADVVIAGNAEAVYTPREIGRTLVVCAAPGNTQEGDLRLYLSPQGRISFKFLSTNLDDLVPTDAAAQAFADEARNALFRLRTH